MGFRAPRSYEKPRLDLGCADRAKRVNALSIGDTEMLKIDSLGEGIACSYLLSDSGIVCTLAITLMDDDTGFNVKDVTDDVWCSVHGVLLGLVFFLMLH